LQCWIISDSSGVNFPMEMICFPGFSRWPCRNFD
jgi:hypothetical protein